MMKQLNSKKEIFKYNCFSLTKKTTSSTLGLNCATLCIFNAVFFYFMIVLRGSLNNIKKLHYKY